MLFEVAFQTKAVERSIVFFDNVLPAFVQKQNGVLSGILTLPWARSLGTFSFTPKSCPP